MIIDFHTHVFPERIAARTIEALAKAGGFTPFSDGTVGGLTGELLAAGAALAVAHPVMTSPTQFDSITRFAASVNEAYARGEGRIISFAGIHPRCEDIESKMRFIKESGFLGVKIHPDYQEAYITDEGYVRIMECAREYDLIVITHAGVDAGYRDKPTRCPAHLALELIKKVPHKKFVLAHLGANEMRDEMLRYIAGTDVYIDTAVALNAVNEEEFVEIIDRHGEDKILFATDSPWGSIKADVQRLRSFSLGKETENKILYENARGLLGL